MMVYELVDKLQEFDKDAEVFIVPRVQIGVDEAFVACDAFEIKGATDAFTNGVYIQADC